MFPNVRISIMLNRVKSYGTLTSLLSFQGVSPPIFQGAFSSFTFLSRGMKQIPRFFLNGEEHSFLPSDRQYTLQRSYFVSPLFAYSLFVESNSLITLSLLSQFLWTPYTVIYAPLSVLLRVLSFCSLCCGYCFFITE